MQLDQPPNTLVLEDFYETFSLALTDAVCCILPDGRFSLSLASEVHPSMGEAVFTFERAELESELVPGTTLSIPYPQGERVSFEEASTHFYFGAHDDPRETTLEIVAVAAASLTVVGRFLWNEQYVPDTGKMRYARGGFHAECRRGRPGELRVLM
jgi:hypothetical protein